MPSRQSHTWVLEGFAEGASVVGPEGRRTSVDLARVRGGRARGAPAARVPAGALPNTGPGDSAPGGRHHRTDAQAHGRRARGDAEPRDGGQAVGGPGLTCLPLP